MNYKAIKSGDLNFITRFFFLFLLFSYVTSCEDSTSEKLSEEDKKGQELAQALCSTCHSYVPPDMLDRISWPRVLGVMRQELKKGDYVVDNEEWLAIQRFYLNNSPIGFNSIPAKKVPQTQSLFVSKYLSTDDNALFNNTMLTYIDEDETIYLGEKGGGLFTMEKDEILRKCDIQGVPIDLKKVGSDYFLLDMGTLNPSNNKNGKLIKWNIENCSTETMVDSLIRPVHVDVTDIDSDQINEYVISSFGSTVGKKATGKLAMYSHEEGGLTEVMLKDLPGPIQSKVLDNKEIVALFTQGNEGIHHISQANDDSYTSQLKIEFSPVYGTNSFDIADMNGDGLDDLVVTSGDNDDYSQVFKSYHGVRIFLNNSEGGYDESFFYHINGASKVKCADFDMDGDVDYVVLAMYADLFSRPWEVLTYFENTDDDDYTIHKFESKPAANWMLLDIGDIDSDGDMDIITAANYEIGGQFPPDLKSEWLTNKVVLGTYYNNTIH